MEARERGEGRRSHPIPLQIHPAPCVNAHPPVAYGKTHQRDLGCHAGFNIKWWACTFFWDWWLRKVPDQVWCMIQLYWIVITQACWHTTVLSGKSGKHDDVMVISQDYWVPTPTDSLHLIWGRWGLGRKDRRRKSLMCMWGMCMWEEEKREVWRDVVGWPGTILPFRCVSRKGSGQG